MRFCLSFMLLVGSMFGQSGSEMAEYFLKNEDELESLENYEIIKSELDKMLADFQSNTRFGDYHKVKEKEWVDISLPPSLDWKGFTYQLRLERKTYSASTIIKELKSLKVYDSLDIEQFNKQANAQIKAKEEETAIALKEKVFELEQKRRKGEIIDERAEIDLKDAKEKLESDLEQFKSSLESQMEEFAKYRYSVELDSVLILSPNTCKVYSTFIIESKKDGQITLLHDEVLKVSKDNSFSYRRINKNGTVIKNLFIPTKEYLSEKTVDWKDVISFVGGYAELSKAGLTKKDVDKFNISFELEGIELLNKSQCLAHVKVNGNQAYGLKYHKINKSSYKYEGNYKLVYDVNYRSLIGYNREPKIEFEFEKKKYMPLDSFSIQIRDSRLPSSSNYKNVVNQMFEDLCSSEEYKNVKRLADLKKKHIQNEKMVNDLVDMILKTPSKKILTLKDFNLSDKDFNFYLLPTKKASIKNTRYANSPTSPDYENYVEELILIINSLGLKKNITSQMKWHMEDGVLYGENGMIKSTQKENYFLYLLTNEELILEAMKSERVLSVRKEIENHENPRK